jgi:hypothetical protein
MYAHNMRVWTGMKQGNKEICHIYSAGVQLKRKIIATQEVRFDLPSTPEACRCVKVCLVSLYDSQAGGWIQTQIFKGTIDSQLQRGGVRLIDKNICTDRDVSNRVRLETSGNFGNNIRQ